MTARYVRKTHGLLGTFLAVLIVVALAGGFALPAEAADDAPGPLLAQGKPVDWWFVFKFNAASFPGCGSDTRACTFGGKVQPYTGGFGQQFVYASAEQPSLQKGSGCAGETTTDPVGATFDQIYENGFYYLIWNDQFYDDPKISGCTKSCSAPWGHSKGLLAWNDAGDGLV